jgi:surface protein
MEWVSNKSASEAEYGPIEDWNIRDVTTFANLFSKSTTKKEGKWEYECISEDFNADISKWDTRKVTSFIRAFLGCTNFNQNLALWNTALVTTMNSAFRGHEKMCGGTKPPCSIFNGDVSTWDTSKVKMFSGTFYGAAVFNSDVSKWNTGKLINTGNMFNGAAAFNIDVSSWDMSGVTNMQYMFTGAKLFNQDLCPWLDNGFNFDSKEEAFFFQLVALLLRKTLLKIICARHVKTSLICCFFGALLKIRMSNLDMVLFSLNVYVYRICYFY